MKARYPEAETQQPSAKFEMSVTEVVDPQKQRPEQLAVLPSPVAPWYACWVPFFTAKFSTSRVTVTPGYT